MTSPQQLDDLLPDDLLEDEAAPPRIVHALLHTSLTASLSGMPLILRPGDPVEVTQDLRDYNTDRTGRCALDRTDLFAPGPAPAGMLPEPGTPEHDDAHKAAHEAAWRIIDPEERRIAVARVRETYGYLGASRTLRSTAS
jgi:hypothetical protein